MAFEVRYSMENYDLVERIDSEIEKRSLLKHPFYQMWSEGRLTVDNLQGYSKEYFQLVKAVPKFVQNIVSANTNAANIAILEANLHEELEHIEPWSKFAVAMGVPQSELASYAGTAKTNAAVAKIMAITSLSFEESVAAMYAFEAELPKISKSKVEGLMKFYGMTGNKDALNYFEIHQEADVRHAQVWREILSAMPFEQCEKAFAAAEESLKAQNQLLDSVNEKYVCSACN